MFSDATDGFPPWAESGVVVTTLELVTIMPCKYFSWLFAARKFTPLGCGLWIGCINKNQIQVSKYWMWLTLAQT